MLGFYHDLRNGGVCSKQLYIAVLFGDRSRTTDNPRAGVRPTWGTIVHCCQATKFPHEESNRRGMHFTAICLVISWLYFILLDKNEEALSSPRLCRAAGHERSGVQVCQELWNCLEFTLTALFAKILQVGECANKIMKPRLPSFFVRRELRH